MVAHVILAAVDDTGLVICSFCPFSDSGFAVFELVADTP